MSRSLRDYLEYQADRVEALLAVHRAPGRVTGGSVGPRRVRFVLNPAPHIRFSAIKRLADDLALALRVPALRVERGTDGIVLTFPNPDPQPVALLPLLAEVQPLPAATALLGLTDEGDPLLARLSAPEVTHVLVAGATGSGKSVLLRTLAASLVLGNAPSALRLLCLDPKGRTFRALAGAPHLVRPAVTAPGEMAEALRSLVHVMEVRDRRGEVPSTGRAARVVVLIDELADLMMAGEGGLEAALTRLVQRGREAGIHVVAATQRPSAAILSGVLRANFPLRLVGRVVSTNDAQVAAGRGGTDAHLLRGRGDFLAVTGGDTAIRFQVAEIKARALREEVAALGGMGERRGRPALTQSRR
jgi:S-DNA-T family DNA segregation ATPase FtsK/SpoIIIE